MKGQLKPVQFGLVQLTEAEQRQTQGGSAASQFGGVYKGYVKIGKTRGYARKAHMKQSHSFGYIRNPQGHR